MRDWDLRHVRLKPSWKMLNLDGVTYAESPEYQWLKYRLVEIEDFHELFWNKLGYYALRRKIARKLPFRERDFFFEEINQTIKNMDRVRDFFWELRALIPYHLKILKLKEEDRQDE